MATFEQLTEEQQEVVRIWGEGVAVQAGAGSGKTTTLVVKCEELVKRKPDARICAVSFTERSASDLRLKLTRSFSALPGLENKVELGGVLGPHWVTTIHGLCGNVIREFAREAGLDGEESVLDEVEAAALWERAIAPLWSDELAPELIAAMDRLLERESRKEVLALLGRIREVEAYGALESLRRSEDEGTRALALLSDYCIERYESLKRRGGRLDFNDLERLADRALSDPAVAKTYWDRFDLVLIDEFQDTNPLQARLLWRFAKPDRGNLCVVGDPKQSIYRFRDADLTVFEKQCDTLPRRLSLTWNFRSRPGILDFTNEVCPSLFEASGQKYEALVPKREVATEFEPVVRLEIDSPEGLGAWIQAERARGVPLDQMAVLMRKIRGGNERWLKALTEAGVPLALGSGGFFWGDPRTRELVAFLRWWDNPGNALSGATFLRAPWVGVPDEELDQWRREDPTFERPFFASGHPIAAALSRFRARPARPGELLLALCHSDAVEAELGAQVLGVWHRAEELSSRGLDFSQVARHLGQAKDESGRERDVPPPKALGQLTVLTIHGSKGLEFPHVILIDFKERAANRRKAPLMFWQADRGAFFARLKDDGERDEEIEADWREEEHRRELAEVKRLFYVALTRAQERLILVQEKPKEKPEAPVADAKRKPKKEAEPDAELKKDHWRAWLDRGGVALTPVQAIVGGGVSKIVAETPPLLRRNEPYLRQRPRHSVTEWNTLARCPRHYEWKSIRPRPEARSFDLAKEAISRTGGLTSQELGTEIHRCFEHRDWDGLAALEKKVGSSRFASGPVIEWARSSPDMAESAPSWSELAFEIPVEGEAVVGSIDRLVHGAQGFSVVDFKFTERDKSVESLTEAYRTQLEIYAWAVSRLEPEAADKVEARIVHLSEKNMKVMEIPLPSHAALEERMLGHARAARRIVAGEEGVPRPGPLCEHCEYRGACPEGRRAAKL